MSRPKVAHPLFALTMARVLEFVREPAALFWVFGFPILLAVGLGIAFRVKPPEKLRVAVRIEGSAPSAVEARLLEVLARSEELEAVGRSPSLAAEELKKAKVDLVVETSSAATLEALAVTFRWDATQPKGKTARMLADEAIERAAGRRDLVKKRDRADAEAGERYIDFLVPGLIGLNLMSSGMWGIGYAVVETRSRKLLKRFAATPMRRSHYLLSFILSRFFFLVAEVVALVAFAALAFDVRVRGSYLDLALLTTLGSLSFAGIALLVAARPKTVETASGLMNLAMMPSWFLSGTFFSYERFPEVVHPLIRALPLTALTDGLRGVMNDGKPLSAIGLELLVLALWGGIGFVVSLRIFRWK